MKSFKFVFKSAINAFTRQGTLTVATCFALFLAVVLATSLYFFQGINSIAQEMLKEKVDMSITFKEDVQKNDILKIQDELSQMKEVKKVEYISPQQAYEEFTQLHQNDDFFKALQAIEINPFLASLKIQLSDTRQFQTVLDFFKKDEVKDLVYKVDDYKRSEVMQKLSSITSKMNTIGIAITIFLGLMAALITFNTIRLSIISQKDEIEIMKLVGAKDNLIMGPFLIQGFLTGLIASILAFALFYLALFGIQGTSSNFFFGVNLFQYFLANMGMIFLVQFLVGIGLSMISSYIAVKKFLKV